MRGHRKHDNTCLKFIDWCKECVSSGGQVVKTAKKDGKRSKKNFFDDPLRPPLNVPAGHTPVHVWRTSMLCCNMRVEISGAGGGEREKMWGFGREKSFDAYCRLHRGIQPQGVSRLQKTVKSRLFSARSCTLGAGKNQENIRPAARRRCKKSRPAKLKINVILVCFMR